MRFGWMLHLLDPGASPRRRRRWSPSARDRDRDRTALAQLSQAGDHPVTSSFPHGVVFSFDRDLRYLSAGGPGLAELGMTREMLEGRTVLEALPAATSAVAEPLYRAALDGHRTTHDVPFAGRVLEQRLAPVRDASGAVVAGLGLLQDVTRARAAEAALRASEERNRLTFLHAPIGKAIVGLDGTWRDVNAALVTFTGYSEDQLLGMTFQDITHPDDLDLDLGLVRRLLDDEIGTYQLEKRYITASGKVVWALLSVALVRDEDGSPLYFVSQVQDITESKRQHEALQDLTAMLAHDLRTPAGVILGFAELLDGPVAADPEQVRDFAHRISTSARAIRDLLDNALTASTLDSGHLEAAPHAVVLREAVATAIAAVDLGSMRTNLSGLGDAVAWVDPVHLHQSLTNLLTNAVKYGGDEVSFSSSTADGRVRLEVSDNGPGVDPHFVPHLFDRFSRSDAVRSGPQRGTGLGLHIVRDLLAANGATIDYAPSALRGAAFTLDLALAPSRTDPLQRGGHTAR